jgi:hypothetical protein
VTRKMRTEIDVIGAKAKGGAKNDFVEDRCCGVDDELAAFGGAHDSAEIAGVDGGDRDDRPLAKKKARAHRIAVTAPDDVSLAFEQLREKGTSGAGAQDEDSHDVSKLYHRVRSATEEERVAGIALHFEGA